MGVPNIVASGDQDAAILEQRGGVAGTWSRHCSRDDECARRLCIQGEHSGQNRER
jgi:hypothetical protein